MEKSPAPGVSPVIDRFHGGHEGYAVYVNPHGVGVLASNKPIPAAGWNVAGNLPIARSVCPDPRNGRTDVARHDVIGNGNYQQSVLPKLTNPLTMLKISARLYAVLALKSSREKT